MTANDGIALAKRPRRRLRPRWRGRAILGGLLALAVATGAATGWWLWRGGVASRAGEFARWRMIALGAELGLRVREVLVVGRRETSRQALLEAVRVERGAPMLGFDPEEARRRVEALSWVRSAVVTRLLPDTVVVSIVERQPLALWQRRGRFALIDRDGIVIQENDLGRFAGLLHVVGEDAPARVGELLRLLASEPELMARIKAAVRVGGRRWDLRMDNDIDVRLPEDDALAAWARLAEYERAHGILARDLEVLDLRLPDRLIVRRVTPPAAPEKPTRRAKAPGRET